MVKRTVRTTEVTTDETMDDNWKGSKRHRVLQEVDDVLLYEGGEIAEERQSEITRVRIGPQVKEIHYGTFGCFINLTEVQLNDGLKIIGNYAFYGCRALRQVKIPSSVTKLGNSAFDRCIKLAEVQFDEGSALEVVGENAFEGCEALQSVTIPSSVTKLGGVAFSGCINLAEVQLNDGLQDIGPQAFYGCTALRSVAVPRTTNKFGLHAFVQCTNLTEVIFLGGKRLINQGFLERGLFSGQGVLNHRAVNAMVVFRGLNALYDCPVTTIKISISQALSERMTRLSQECRLSIEGRIRDLHQVELRQDGNALACFPVIRNSLNDMNVDDTDNQTSESLHQVLRLISFHELKESSILVELALWKSRLVEDRARADCRASIPDPAKSLIMEYCGFADFLEPAIEGD